MTKMNRIATVLGVMGVLTLGACGNLNSPFYDTEPGVATSGSRDWDRERDRNRELDRDRDRYTTYGVVQEVELLRGNNRSAGGSGIGLGTIAGAVVGGVVGNQVGSGSGNTAATVIGAAGGAYIGHELENRQRQPRQADEYKITVRMEDGSYHEVVHHSATDFRAGDRVRIRNGVMERY